jgi:hypothetical protein
MGPSVMGTELYTIGDGQRAAQKWLISDVEWTSVIVVQGHQRLNIGIVIGNQISDILSHIGHSEAISATASVFSGTISLQRRMREEDQDFHWRDVATWAIASVSGGEGGSENITTYSEPETCQYRAGVDTGEYNGGAAIVRIGTS